MSCEILAIGDEITSGQLLDTNSQWLAQRLEAIGLRVLHHTSVGDDLPALTAAFRQAIERSDVILCTGGLGPTEDDVTREALAAALGRELVKSEAALEHIRALFARRQRPMPQRNELQALLPEGAEVVDNPHGTAPGIAVEVPRPGRPPALIVCLPGVPAELKEMWHGSVAARLARLGGGEVIVHKQIKCFGAGESQIEALLPPGFLRQTDPRVGVNASQATIIFRISARAADRAACLAKMQPVVDTLREKLGALVFGEDDDELQSVVVSALRAKRRTLALVECGTGGLVADWLGGVPGAADVVLGAIAASRIETAATLLGSDGTTPDRLAEAARRSLGADFGLCIGPFPERADDPAAPPVQIALSGPDGVRHKQVPCAGHPALLRVLPAKHGLDVLRLVAASVSRRDCNH